MEVVDEAGYHLLSCHLHLELLSTELLLFRLVRHTGRLCASRPPRSTTATTMLWSESALWVNERFLHTVTVDLPREYVVYAL